MPPIQLPERWQRGGTHFLQAPVPRQISLFAPFLTVWIMGLSVGLPFNAPRAADIAFLLNHYMKPLIYAAVAQLALYAWKRDRRYLVALKWLPFLVGAVLVHFQFKAWMGLAPEFFDRLLWSTDNALHPIVSASSWLRDHMVVYLGENGDIAYHVLFVWMFYISIVLHSLFDTEEGQVRVVGGVAMILLLGGVTYWAMPALGPFVFRGAGNPFAERSQQIMLRGLTELRTTGLLPHRYFTAPLAAMPSLHIAHALFLTLCAMASRRLYWLGGIYIPFLVFLSVEAVTSGWHYVLDLPAGAILAVIVFVGMRPDRPAPLLRKSIAPGNRGGDTRA